MPEVLAVVTRVRACVLDLRWIASAHASMFTRLISGVGGSATLAHRGDGTHAIAIADYDAHGLQPGAELVLAVDSSPIPLSPARLEAIARALEFESPARPPTRRLATGIKLLDVMSPLVDGGTTWLIGGHDVGRMKFLEELHLRLAGGPGTQTVVFPIVPEYAASIPQTLADQPSFPPDANAGTRSIWLISDAANQPALAERALGTTRLVFDPSLAARGCWPAVDVLASRSALPPDPLDEAERLALVERISALLRWAAQQRASPNDEPDPAREAMARALERYFAQPFHSARSFSGIAGTHVPIDVALTACRAILAGREPSDGYDFPPQSQQAKIVVSESGRRRPAK